MIAWMFWRIVETLIVYAVCSLFTDPPNTLGAAIAIEGILIIFYIGNYFLSMEKD